MFDRAQYFKIKDSVFADIGNNAKIYVKKIYSTSASGANSREDAIVLDNPRARGFRRILPGDIELLDKLEKHYQESRGNLFDDYVVEVTGEHKKRRARFYNGKMALECLKMDFDMISKLRHPRISQVFGICNSKDRLGLVFHDDGEGCDYEQYSASMKPIERAVYLFKYLQEHNGAKIYLEQTISSQRNFWPDDISVVIGEDRGECSYKVDFNVKTDGRLNITLSVTDERFLEKSSSIKFGVADIQRLSLSSKKLIESAVNKDNICGSQSHNQTAELINIWHSAVLMVTNYSFPHEINNVVLGQPITIDNAGSYYTHSYYFEPTLQERQQSFRGLPYDPSGVFHPKIYTDTTKVGSLTCMELNIEGFKNWVQTNGNNPVEFTYIMNLSLSDQQLYRTQFAEVIRMWCPSFSLFHTRFGIVNGLHIKLFAHIHQFSLLQYMKSNPGTRIYLAIYDPVEVDGKSKSFISPTPYWSLDKTGVERLSGISALQKGLGEIGAATVTAYMLFWDHTFYKALHEVYNRCNLTASDVAELLGLQKLTYNKEIICYSVRSLSRMDALDIRSSVGKEEIIERKPDIPYYWNSPFNPNLPTYYYSPFKRPDINSLSWIGITVLEDYKAVRATWYETSYSRLKRLKPQEQELQDFIKMYGHDQEWVDIMKESICTDEVVEGVVSVEEWVDVA